jgi:hypothetical protein
VTDEGIRRGVVCVLGAPVWPKRVMLSKISHPGDFLQLVPGYIEAQS